MGEFFPLLYFPEDYFPEGYFGEMAGSGTSYADAELTANGAGSAAFAAGGVTRAALMATGLGSASLNPMVPDVPLPATPVGGASGGFGRVWTEARLRRFADAGLAVAGRGDAVFAARGEMAASFGAVGVGSAVFEAELVAAPVKQATVQRDHELELWLLAA